MPSIEVGSSETTVMSASIARADLVDLAVADRADAAQLLGQDEVRLGGGEGRLVERVQRRPAVHRGRDRSWMSREVAPGIVRDVPGHDRLADDLRRPVALVGDADELVTEADGADDLRGGRQERDDAHRAPVRRSGPRMARASDGRATRPSAGFGRVDGRAGGGLVRVPDRVDRRCTWPTRPAATPRGRWRSPGTRARRRRSRCTRSGSMNSLRSMPSSKWMQSTGQTETHD